MNAIARRATLVACLTVSCALAPCTVPTAAATDTNVFAFGNYTGGSDVEGALAAGGDIVVDNFGAGNRLTSAQDGENTMVAGGTIRVGNGQLDHGNAVAGSTVSQNASFHVAKGRKIEGMQVIDFPRSIAEYKAFSARLSALTANGTTDFQSWGGLTLTGTDAGVNVFDVAVSSPLYVFNIVVPQGALAVINWAGNPAAFRNYQFNANLAQKVEPGSVLFNFEDATALRIDGFDFKASAIAPYADVVFNNGQFNGQLVANAVSGNGEFHDVTSRSTIPTPLAFAPPATAPVPEPATWAMLLVGLGCAGAMLRRRRAVAAPPPATA